MDWLNRWRTSVLRTRDVAATSAAMKRVNPSITWREWLVAPAYREAEQGSYGRVRALQEVLSRPYEDLPPKIAMEYNRLRPREFFHAGGVSHYSCSS